jgi:hypothetical protein
MLRKFVEATRLSRTHFVLIASIILTVGLPGNLFGEYLIWYVPSNDEVARSFRIGALIEGVFGPIYCGALVYVLAQLKYGRRPSYFEAISVGLRTWGRLFSARFFAGLWIVFGIVLLVGSGNRTHGLLRLHRCSRRARRSRRRSCQTQKYGIDTRISVANLLCGATVLYR